MNKLVLYYDPVSPWARVGLKMCQRYQKAWNLDLQIRPTNLGYIMKEAGNRPPVSVPNKGKWMWEDMGRAEKFFGITLQTPSGFPVNTMPSLCLLREIQDDSKSKSLLLVSCMAISDGLWGGPDAPVQTAEDLYSLVGPIFEKAGQGEHLKELLEKSLTKEKRDRLKKEGKELADQGCFGFPWMVVTRNSDGATANFFGSDRFEQMGAWLGLPYKGPLANGSQPKL